MHFSSKALLALAAFVASGDAQADLGWELLATSSGAEIPRVCTPTKTLPSWVKGSFFIAGPALFEMGGIAFKSLFDGYGRTNKFEMQDGEVCYTSVWLNTSYYLAAKKLGHVGPGVLFEGTIPERPPCPTMDPVCDLQGPMDNNWVNMMPMGKEALMLTDAPLMVRFDLETMAVSGAYPWEDKLDWKYHRATTGSAHPLLRPGTESTYIEIAAMVPIVPFAHPFISVYSLDSKVGQKRTLLAKVPMKSLLYFHSFGVTKNYVVLPCNLKLGMNSSMMHHRPEILDSFQETWDGIHVVDLAGNVQVFNTEHFFHVHIANTFENATGIVMDLGVDSSIPFSDGPQLTTAKFLNKTLRDAVPRNEFRRYHLHTSGPANGTVTFETFTSGVAVDFFRINSEFSGKPYCYAYMSEWFHDRKSYASLAVLKQDMCTGEKKYWYRKNTYPGEPNFVPKPGGAEDDGVVVFVALDGEKRTSLYVVLDGKTLEELAVVTLPAHIPFTAHGTWWPAAGAAVASAIAGGVDPEKAAVDALNEVLV